MLWQNYCEHETREGQDDESNLDSTCYKMLPFQRCLESRLYVRNTTKPLFYPSLLITAESLYLYILKHEICWNTWHFMLRYTENSSYPKTSQISYKLFCPNIWARWQSLFYCNYRKVLCYFSCVNFLLFRCLLPFQNMLLSELIIFVALLLVRYGLH